MRNISKCLGVLAVVLLVASFTYAAQAPTPPPAAQPQADKAFSGTLVKVDTDAKMLVAKDADNKEMQFAYTDKTEVVGSEKTVQGLAAKSGAKLKVTYKTDRGVNNATRIELMP
jgi:hypothetical protein